MEQQGSTPTVLRPHKGFAWALANTNKLPEAAKEAKLAVEWAPNSADNHSNLAWIYSKKGDFALLLLSIDWH